jgi:mono/diheme cytochrome c family protein
MSEPTTPAVAPVEKIARKVKETTEVIVTISLDLDFNRWRDDDTNHSFNERQAALAERAAKDFNDFLRDHRSQDANRLDVRRVTEDHCSACHEKWETYADEDDGFDHCANCGAKVEK